MTHATNRVLKRSLALACSLALATAVAACGGGGGKSGNNSGGSQNVPGVTDTEVIVGSHQPLTGPAAPGYSKIAPATKAYFDYVNAHGGVNGRKITYKYVDDGYNPSRTQQVVRQLVLQDKVFAILNGLGTPTHSGVLDFLKSNRVPDLFVASGALAWNQPTKFPYTFGYQPNYTVESKVLAQYVKQTYPNQKVCFLGQNDDFGRDGLSGVEKVLGPTGLAAKDTYVPTNANVGPQIGKFKAAGCTVVMLDTVPGFTALTLGTAAKLAFKPSWVVSSVGADYRTLAGRLGAAGKPLLEGLVGAGYLPPVDDDSNPWTQLFKKINSDAKGPEYDGNVAYGFSVGYLFVQALQKAGKNLTRQGIVDAIEAGGFKGPGIVPLLFSKTNHSGYGGVQLGKVTNGKQLPFGAIYTTDDADGAITEYKEAPATPTSDGIPSP